MIFLILFILDQTLFHYKKLEEDKWGPWYITSFVTQIITLLFCVYFYIIEFIQIMDQKLGYLQFWNMIDIISITLNTTTICCGFVEIDEI